ncbi:hypothetical protein KFE25_001981 [Diacronema lutheri]|uniref:Uncharacterized protein n=1 Tax=Diacronema lutheri TaxID=2081491 RepID=A0A8J5XVK1_DIALT|nr:hypothetical protein KFE25_001981 [Diacronema lutheri]
MHGLLCVHARSGALLYSRALRPAFGLSMSSGDAALDALRLASSLFAWHANAAAVNVRAVSADGGARAEADEPLVLYTVGEVSMHVHVEPRAQLLVVAVTSSRVPHERGLALAAAIGGEYAARVTDAAAAFSRTVFSAAVAEAFGSAIPLAYARACLDAADGASWAWILNLGTPSAERAATFDGWARLRGAPWPPAGADAAMTKRGHARPWRAHSAPGTAQHAAASRTRGPWLAQRVAPASDRRACGEHAGAGAGTAAAARTRADPTRGAVSGPAPWPWPPLELPTAAHVPALLRTLARGGLETHGALSGWAELAAPPGDGSEGRAACVLLLRRGATLLGLGLLLPEPRAGEEGPAESGRQFALADARAGCLLAELDELLAEFNTRQ